MAFIGILAISSADMATLLELVLGSFGMASISSLVIGFLAAASFSAGVMASISSLVIGFLAAASFSAGVMASISSLVMGTLVACSFLSALSASTASAGVSINKFIAASWDSLTDFPKASGSWSMSTADIATQEKASNMAMLSLVISSSIIMLTTSPAIPAITV
ncbi:hypothetical protein BJ741DRAFT_593903 [Chytriomyces cf. hyalinus JEL632]|nr:hypothetical protein BJ741DRAFT_593903 [Chytriomyces cf. hyalinus JEL632]